MLKYAKVIDEQTKLCEVGTGTDSEYYQSIGMTEQEVEQAYDGSWYVLGYAPKKPLNEIKAEKRAEINTARDAAEQGGFEYLGKTFDSDQISAQRISMAAQAMALAPDGTTITWTCQDNSTIDLTAQELVGLVVALAQHSNTCHEKATALKAKIEEAKSEEELNKINWCEKNQIIPIACCRKPKK